MFRDDHEAALARVAALEQELARAKADDTAQAQRLLATELQLADAKRKLAEAERQLEAPRREQPPVAVRPSRGSERTPAPRGNGLLLAGLGLVTIMLGYCAIAAVGRSDSESETATTRGRPPGSVFVDDHASRLLSSMRARVREQKPHARLIELRGKAIDKRGSMREPDGQLEAIFHSPGEPNCIFVRRTVAGWDDSPLDPTRRCATEEISDRSVVAPDCSMRAIWERAIADGAPSSGAADIRIRGSRWSFQIGETFRREYVDDCTIF